MEWAARGGPQHRYPQRRLRWPELGNYADAIRLPLSDVIDGYDDGFLPRRSAACCLSLGLYDLGGNE
jgi:hypothetical protein